MSIEKFEKTFSLAEQFEKREILELQGGKVEVIDIKPNHQKTEAPVVVAPGWTATPEIFKENILTLAELGRRAISINSPHGIEVKKIKNLPEAELRKVTALIETLENKDIDKVDAVGHSEAGIYLTLAATLYPDKFRNIVLVDPGGMIGQDNPKRLVSDFSKDTLAQIKRSVKDPKLIKPILKIFKESSKIIASNPLKSLSEVMAISGSQIHELLKGLKDKGIGISVIHAVDDKAFPMDKVQKIAQADQLHGFYSVKGTHNEFVLNPKRYTELADEALTALENRTK